MPSMAPHAEDPAIAELIAARPHLSMHAMDGLLLDQVPLARIADVLGTPGWVYSAGTMRARLAELQAALAGLARVHYAVKANDHLAVLRLMAQGGAGADVVSEGELRRARAAGIPRAGHRVFRRRQDGARNPAGHRRGHSARSTSKAPRSWRSSRALAAVAGAGGAGGAAHQSRRGCRHACQDHHRHGEGQVRHSLRRSG